MNDIKKILDLYLKACLGPRMIARALNKPKSTISDYINRFNRSDLKREDLDAMSAKEIYRSLFPAENPRPKKRCDRIAPDLNRMHLELKKKYVTRQLLWQEYREMYPDTHYGYTRFCNLYRDYQKRLNISMRINHKAGEKMFMDFSGLKWHIIDRESGEEKEVEIFVASLGASGYTFAEAAPDQTRASLISCAVHAFEFFGGVSEIIVLDNLKSAVTKADRYDPDINSSFQDMADHYDCVVIPARPYRAKDKGKVENSVRYVKHNFLMMQDTNDCAVLNQRKRRWMDKINNKVHSTIQEIPLRRLPQENLSDISGIADYPLYYLDTRKIFNDSTFSFHCQRFSVPPEYIGKRMTVKHRPDMARIDVYYKDKCVTQHRTDTAETYVIKRSHRRMVWNVWRDDKKLFYGRHEDQIDNHPLEIYEQISRLEVTRESAAA